MTLFGGLIGLWVLLVLSSHSFSGTDDSISSQSLPEKYFIAKFVVTKNWGEIYVAENGSFDGVSSEGLEFIRSHFSYMDELHQAGKIVSGGPTFSSDKGRNSKHIDGAVFIYRGYSIDEIEGYLKRDPFIINSVMTVSDIKMFSPGIPFK